MICVMFYVEAIKSNLKPIEYEVANKVYVEYKDRNQVMKEM